MQKKVNTVRFVFVFGPINCIFHTNKSKEYRITNLQKLVTSYGNVKSEIQAKLVFYSGGGTYVSS